jgi:alkanesulfonate monooxygenase SsuD/methylene tetrahydromethanopterin reductase-like flavin-dependent oxidoreductase (luciferase family)
MSRIVSAQGGNMSAQDNPAPAADEHPWASNSAQRIRFGIVTTGQSWPEIRDLAQMAEGLGFDSFCRIDHPMLGHDTWTTLAALEEAIQIIRPLLRGETVTFAGTYYHADGAVLRPSAVQQPYIPLLIGGGGERTTLRYVAQYADASSMAAAHCWRRRSSRHWSVDRPTILS